MNLARVQSYLQIVVTGIILILAVVADEQRRRLMVRLPG
jgi:ribose/xylose/arabinose/galactoside ABC-type transport system permease subunit